MSDGTQDDSRQIDIVNCYRICRNFEDSGAKLVVRKLKEHFHDKTNEEIAELVVDVEKITSQSSSPAGA